MRDPSPPAAGPRRTARRVQGWLHAGLGHRVCAHLSPASVRVLPTICFTLPWWMSMHGRKRTPRGGRAGSVHVTGVEAVRREARTVGPAYARGEQPTHLLRLPRTACGCEPCGRPRTAAAPAAQQPRPCQLQEVSRRVPAVQFSGRKAHFSTRRGVTWASAPGSASMMTCCCRCGGAFSSAVRPPRAHSQLTPLSPSAAQRWHVRHLSGVRPDDFCDNVAGKTFIVTGPTRCALRGAPRPLRSVADTEPVSCSGIGTEVAAALSRKGAHSALCPPHSAAAGAGLPGTD